MITCDRTNLTRRGIIAACLAFAAMIGPNAVWANAVSNECDRAAVAAADANGVPLSVLRAITRTETGRRQNGALRPWPWTVNMEGKGAWFDTLDEAKAFVFRHFKRGARSFDIGCFQINYKWHSHGFRSIDEMFDPDANASYAAGFLKALHAETGDWNKAAGAFHSRTPEYARRYEARFSEIHAALSPMPERAPVSKLSTLPRTTNNRFPLLRGSGTSGSLGSLVPRGARVGGAFLSLGKRGDG